MEENLLAVGILLISAVLSSCCKIGMDKSEETTDVFEK
jgi:hypothetical protein